MSAWLRKHDIATRIVALLGALVLWYFVIQVVDPQVSKTISLKVNLDGMETLEGRGLVVTSGRDLTVNVTFTGNYSIIYDIIAAPDQYGRLKINLANYYAPFRSTISASWEWNSGQPGMVSGVIASPTFMAVEAMKEVNVPVELVLTGSAPQGFSVEALHPNPAYVKVTGPDSMVSVIEKAVATYDISSIREAVSTIREVTFFNAEGTQLNLGSELVTIEQQTVAVTINVRQEKAVNLKNMPYLNYPDFLAPDAIVTQISPSSLNLTGEPDDVEKINSIELDSIDIMAFLMSDEAYALGSVQREISIPNGASSAAGNAEVATVYISFPGYVRQKLVITEVNLPQDERFTYDEQSITLTLFGPGEDPEIALIDPESLTVVYGTDPDSLEPGEQELAVTFQCEEEGVQVLGSYTLRITVPEPESTEEDMPVGDE